jgi:hypothetical protein
MQPRNVKSTWWVGPDLYVEYEERQVDVFQDAYLTSMKTEYPKDSGIEVTDVVLCEENGYRDLLGK